MNRQTEPVKSVAERRSALGLTPTDLASRTGLSLRTIERIESGDIRRPHRLTRKAIARVLKCDPLDLWPREADAQPERQAA